MTKSSTLRLIEQSPLKFDKIGKPMKRGDAILRMLEVNGWYLRMLIDRDKMPIGNQYT
jgi:hypothetical protein